MALNITFTCNNVYDENGNAIDCKYQAYYPEHGVWTDVKDTDSQQYNFNAGDSDGLTQNGELKAGEHVVICFWQDSDSNSNRSGLKDRFSYIVHTHDGSTSTYVQDVQLLPKTAPTVNGYLLDEGLRNHQVRISNFTNDSYEWTYSDATHYHNRNYENGELLFDSVAKGPTKTEVDSKGNYYYLDADADSSYNDYLNMDMDWKDSNDNVDSYENHASHTFTEIGDYKPVMRATNLYGLSATKEFSIRIRYNAPVGCVTFDKDNYLIGDDIKVTACIEDVDSTINNITHRWVIEDDWKRLDRSQEIKWLILNPGDEIELSDDELYNYNVIRIYGDSSNNTGKLTYHLGDSTYNFDYNDLIVVEPHREMVNDSSRNRVTYDNVFVGKNSELIWRNDSAYPNDFSAENDTILEDSATLTIIDRDSDSFKVDSNTNKDYEYTKTAYVIKKHTAMQVIKWNDGFDDQVTTFTRSPVIVNQAPITKYDLTMLSNKSVRATPHCIDLDNDIASYKWQLFLLLPFSSNWQEVKDISKVTPNNEKLEIDFNSPGHYKLELTTTDVAGLSSSYSKEFDISTATAADCDTYGQITNDIYFLFPDKGLF